MRLERHHRRGGDSTQPASAPITCWSGIFFQLQARAPRNEPDVFVQHDDALVLTTLNGVSQSDPAGRVRWRLEDKNCGAISAGYRHSPADVKPEGGADPRDVKEMTWRFWKEGWQNKWTDTAHQPDGVELLLTMENGDTGAGCYHAG